MSGAVAVERPNLLQVHATSEESAHAIHQAQSSIERVANDDT